jgi:hypothetical protein
VNLEHALRQIHPNRANLSHGRLPQVVLINTSTLAHRGRWGASTPSDLALAPLAAGFKKSKFRPQGREGAKEKLDGFCSVTEEALEIANKDLDRLVLARELMNRVTDKCRSNSKLPELVDLFLSRPLVTVPLGAKLLKVTPKAVDLMLAQLGGALPRELTGRTRYRAWGIV